MMIFTSNKVRITIILVLGHWFAEAFELSDISHAIIDTVSTERTIYASKEDLSVDDSDLAPMPNIAGAATTKTYSTSHRDLSSGSDSSDTPTVCVATTRQRFLPAVDQVNGIGNLRGASHRSLNGWFACGSNTYCVNGRATCVVDVNDIGTCTCMDGYGGIECRPVNECEIDFPCPGGSFCVDMFPPMRFKCICEDGFTPFLPNKLPNEPGVPLDYRPISCLDKLECDAEEFPCHQDADCTNTIGGFECVCRDGLVGNGITTCTKPQVTTTTGTPDGICMISTDCQGSNMQCVNSTCVCLPGYAQVGPNCQNEVHCDPGGFNNDCHRRATCTEEDGFPGFSCKCVDGWEDTFEGANGKSCKDIPPITEAPPPPEPVTDEILPAGVGPHPNRPTLFPPTCLPDGAPCGDGVTANCCSGNCGATPAP